MDVSVSSPFLTFVFSVYTYREGKGPMAVQLDWSHVHLRIFHVQGTNDVSSDCSMDNGLFPVRYFTHSTKGSDVYIEYLF